MLVFGLHIRFGSVNFGSTRSVLSSEYWFGLLAWFGLGDPLVWFIDLAGLVYWFDCLA